MYYLWAVKGMLPSEFYNLKAGEKLILRAFVETKVKNDKKNEALDLGGEI